jgi:hypothetical protein
MAAMTKMQRRLRAANREQASAQKTLERAKKMRARAQADRAALVAQTADGLSPEKRKKILAAQRRAADDPKAKALLERAEIEKRVRDKRKEMGLGVAVPEMMLGEPIKPSEIPESVAQRRARKAKS